MSSDATLRELKAGLEDSTTMAVPQPWSFRPMDAEAWSRRYHFSRLACKLLPGHYTFKGNHTCVSLLSLLRCCFVRQYSHKA